jgi:CubicO group peptidase (beta-lactamase class C family)
MRGMKSTFRFLALLIAVSLHAAEPARKIATALQPFVDKHELAGAVALVATSNKVLDVTAVGWMDVAAKRPMRTDCLFWIASQSKPITATALMMLVNEGKVNLDDPVEKYLPEFKGQMVAVEQDGEHMLLKKPKHPITVRNVLSHTSGLPFKSAIEQPTLDLYPLAVRVGSYAMTPLLFEPDAKSQYSNAGINTAGRIIEVVSGMSYESFLDKRLFRPLGMRDTTFWPSAAQLRRLAKAYKPAGKTGLEETTINQLYYPLNSRIRQPMPAGGLFSTASDMCRFAQLILNNGEIRGKRLLSEAAVKQMTNKQTGDAIKTSYGFGFAVGDGWCGHGGAYGTNTQIDREHGLITIWLVQHAGFPGDGKKCQDLFKKTALEQFGK